VKTKLSGMMVGLFVLGALVVGAGALIWLGSVKIFSKPKRFVVCFDESVTGLDPGAQVKLRGVRAGRVQSIRVASHLESLKSVVVVICEMEADVFEDSEGTRVDITDPPTTKALVARGLRASVQYAGITGLRFVDLDLLDPEHYPPRFPPRWALERLEYPVVPALKSTYAEFTETLTDLLTQLKSADLGGIVGGLKTVLESLNQKIGETDLKALLARMTGAAGAIEELMGAIAKEGTVAEIKKLVAATTTLAEKLGTQIGPAGKEATETLKEARKAFQSANRVLAGLGETFDGRGGLGDEATRALSQIAAAAASIQRLADYLERNPNALLTGKKFPEGR